jgi:hypothetical protein
MCTGSNPLGKEERKLTLHGQMTRPQFLGKLLPKQETGGMFLVLATH